MVSRPKCAFTLIELLVVISVIAILAGMLLAVVPMVREAVKKSRTGTIIQQVALGMETTAAERGGYASIVPHALAGYAPPRSPFARGPDVSGFTPGDAVSTSGTDVRVTSNPAVASHTAYTAIRAQILLPSDVFANKDVPLFYGVSRERMTMIGSAAGLGSYSRLVDPALAGQVRSEDLAVSDNGTLAQLESQSRAAIELALGPAIIAELTTLGALKTTTSGTLIADNRLYADKPGSDPWQPGQIKSGGSWTTYRLRGAAIYDGWGRELLVWFDAKGRYAVESAGKDGVFRFAPGKNSTLDSDAWAVNAAGDDKDGSYDNLSSSAARK
jgi:prepilin-type N-terminal cleavage/methylation domain-containing protein